jgi:hypothetical protein
MPTHIMDDPTHEPTEYLRGTLPTTLAPTSEIINETYLIVIISISSIIILLGILYIRKVYHARL